MPLLSMRPPYFRLKYDVYYMRFKYSKRGLDRSKQYQESLLLISEEYLMWTKPNFEEMRLGFEVTLYISNR